MVKPLAILSSCSTGTQNVDLLGILGVNKLIIWRLESTGVDISLQSIVVDYADGHVKFPKRIGIDSRTVNKQRITGARSVMQLVANPVCLLLVAPVVRTSKLNCIIGYLGTWSVQWTMTHRWNGTGLPIIYADRVTWIGTE